MSEESQIPEWITVYQRYYDLFGGSLINHHGFSTTDVGVYVFLITQKWFFGQPEHSSNSIYVKLSTIPTYFLKKKYKIKYSEESVGISLKKLAGLGFVNTCKNSNRISTGGRPVNAFYESSKVTELQKNIQKRLENEMANMFNSLSRLAEIEEGIGLKEARMGNKKNDRK